MLSLPNKAGAFRLKSLAGLLVVVLWVAVIGTAVANYQNITDWWRLRGYTAPAPIAALANQTTMTDFGRRVFYVNHPSLVAKSEFRSVCPSAGAEQTIVLGCYHGGQRGIYLLDVSDPRLDGVEQVTAAHEMLHGVYDRLSSSEKERVNRLLEDYYRRNLRDERVRATIEAYKYSEPDDVVNEMHSIFGTEVGQLPAELEDYYKQYFANRAQTVAFANRYQAEFTSRQDAIKRYDTQLERLKADIDAAKAGLAARQQAIDRQQSVLLSQRNSGDIEAYNAGVPVYNGLVEDYNREVRRIRAMIDEYNRLVTERNAVAFEENQLLKDLSTEARPLND